MEQNNKKLVKTANGYEFVEIVDTPPTVKLPKFNEDEVLKLYKSTIIVALQNRLSTCRQSLKEAIAIGEDTTESHIQYKKANGSVYVYSVAAETAMVEAIKLAKEGKFDKFTALMWGQVIKGLVWVKRLTHKPYTFDHLFGLCLEMYGEATAALYYKTETPIEDQPVVKAEPLPEPPKEIIVELPEDK